MTGCNPGKHGIYGFIDRRPGSYDLAFPHAAHRTAPDLWQILSGAGKRVFGMNVPTSYAPQAVNGIIIGGFLAPSLEKATAPPSVSDYLRSIDYRIDCDPMLGRTDKRALVQDLHRTLEARMEAMFHFLDQEDWDFFHTHIMGSDRINHFLWQKMEDKDSELEPAFFNFYREIDRHVGALLKKLPDNVPLLVFSDHGFCSIKQEVQLSRYLIETGWTVPADNPQHPLCIDPARSRAYCLIPGRIFVNLAGREPEGIVPLEAYQEVRDALTTDLMALRAPQTGDPVIRTVVPREQMYWPEGHSSRVDWSPEKVAQAQDTFGRAADLTAIPHDGYDLKLGLQDSVVFKRTELEGMHTYDDAFMMARGIELPEDNLEIMMLARSILQRLQVDAPPDMDGSHDAVTCDF